MRYRWELSHGFIPFPDYAPEVPKERLELRTARGETESRDGSDRFEERLLTPILIAETCELLAARAETGDRIAAQLLAEAEPVYRRDLAGHVQGIHPFFDTFALFCLVRRPRALVRLHPFALAIAAYASAARDAGGKVRGTRYPRHGVPLPSASAHLATGLVALGIDIDLVASLVDFVRAQRRPSGGWADGDDPDELLSTLVCGDLLAHTDPSFDPEPTARFLAGRQQPDGLFRAWRSEAPWLTAEIADLLAALGRPFAERFRFPHRAPQNLDRKTGLPFYAWFADLCELFAGLPGLAAAPCRLAFLDLAGFREFNNRHGQELGDAVLRAVAEELSLIPAAAVVRDGGDEMLIVGAPTGTGLIAELERFRTQWPDRFRARFAGAEPVRTRIVVATTRGAELRAAREELGRRIGSLKEVTLGPDGILADLADLR